MGVPPVLSGRAGRPSHKKHQIVSYLILIPKEQLIKSGDIGIIPECDRPADNYLSRIAADFDDKSIGIVKVNAASCSAGDGAAVDRNFIRL
jgi:hypothetical protein